MSNNGVESRDKICLSCITAIESGQTLVQSNENNKLITSCPVCHTEGQLVKIQRLLDESEALKEVLKQHQIGGNPHE